MLGAAGCGDSGTKSPDVATYDVTLQVDCYVCSGSNFGDSAVGTPYLATTGLPASVTLGDSQGSGRTYEIDAQSLVSVRVAEGHHSFIVESPHGRLTEFDSIYIAGDTTFTLLVRRYYEYHDSLYMSFTYVVSPYYLALTEAEEHQVIHDLLDQVGYVFDTLNMRRETYDQPGARSVVYRTAKVGKRPLWDLMAELSYVLRTAAHQGINIYSSGYMYGLCPEDFKPWDDTTYTPPFDSVPPIRPPETTFDSLIYPPGF